MVQKFLLGLKQAGWKQREIADKSGINRSFISQLQNGDTCGIETVLKLADAFGVTTDEVLGRTEAKPKSPIIEKIEQITEGDDDLAREVLRRAEDEKLIREVRGSAGRGKKAA